MRALSLLTMVAALALVLTSHALADQAAGVGDSRDDWLKANGFFAEGNHLVQAKKYAEAAAKYRKAIEIYPADYHYKFNLALALKHQGDLLAAVDAFKESLALNSKDWKAWKGLANCYYQLGDFKQAEGAFRRALDCAPPAKEVGQLRQGVAASARQAGK
jgi:tetratricopeptide (TPR) repeat protein